MISLINSFGVDIEFISNPDYSYGSKYVFFNVDNKTVTIINPSGTSPVENELIVYDTYGNKYDNVSNFKTFKKKYNAGNYIFIITFKDLKKQKIVKTIKFTLDIKDNVQEIIFDSSLPFGKVQTVMDNTIHYFNFYETNPTHWITYNIDTNKVTITDFCYRS